MALPKKKKFTQDIWVKTEQYGNPNPVENQEYFGKASDKNSDKSIKSNSNQQTPPFKSFKDQTPDDLNPYPKNNSLKHPQVVQKNFAKTNE